MPSSPSSRPVLSRSLSKHRPSLIMSSTHSSSSSLSPAPSLFTSSPSILRSLFMPAFLCLLLVLSFLAHSTADSYTTVPYESHFICLNSSFLIANKMVPPSIGAGSIARPTVILERDGWAGHYLTTSLAAQLLRDALGYSVAIVDVNSTHGDISNIFARLAAADTNTPVQMNFEVWPNSLLEDDYEQYVTIDETAVSAGPLGLVQQSGWYVPTQLVQMDWIEFYDFWKGYKYDTNLTAVFPPSGTTPDSMKVGVGREFIPDWCVLETEPAGCAVNYYNPAYLQRSCNVKRYSPYCIEMYAIDAINYDPGIIQQQITNLQLNITLVFLGETNYNSVMANAIAYNKSFLAYDWTPAVDTSTSALTRVSLPGYTELCWLTVNNTGRLAGNGSINCDFPSRGIFKYFAGSLLSNDSNVDIYRDALYLLSAFNFDNQYQQSLLALMGNVSISQYQYMADRNTCTWLQNNVPIWKSWIQLSPQQRYSDISTAAWIVVIVVIVILCCYSLILHGFVYRYRYHPLLMSSSPFFGQVIISGSWFLYMGVGIMRWKSTEAVCSIIPVFLCIAYTLVIGTLFAKTWRLNRIFKGASLKSVRVSVWDVVLFISCLFTIDFIIIAAWLIIDQPVPVWETDSTNSLQLITVCYSQHWNVWYSLLIVPKGLQVLYGTYLAYNVRHINANFNESRYIGLAILHLVVFAITVIPLDLALQNQLTVHYLLITLMLCLGVFVTLSLVFLPKMYAIVYKRKGQAHKRPIRPADDSKSDAPNPNPNSPGDPGAAAGYRWMRERVMADVSDSDKLSFPSLHGGGFVHAVRIVRLVAEQLYRECGIGEYWQFCVAVRNMSQQELEARAPLLVAYLQQHVTLRQPDHQHHHQQAHQHNDAQQPHGPYGKPPSNHQHPYHAHQHDLDEERKVVADTAMTDVGPLSQDMSMMADDQPMPSTVRNVADVTAAQADDVVVEVPQQQQAASRSKTKTSIRPVEYADYPITQQSFSFAPSVLAHSLRYHSNSQPHSRQPISTMSRQSVLSEDSTTLEQLPPLPADAWTMTNDQIERLTLPGLPSPLSSPTFTGKVGMPHSASSSTVHSQLSPSSAPPSGGTSPHTSFPSSMPPVPLSLYATGGQSFASQVSFSVLDEVADCHPTATSLSIPSPSESSVPFSTHSPTSPNNHHSTTHSGGGSVESGSGSLRGSAMESGSEAGAISSGSGGAGRVVKNGSSRLSVTGSSGVSGGGGLRSASLSDSENSVTFH